MADGLSSSGSSSTHRPRRRSRTSSDGSRLSKGSRWSDGSYDLVIRHFQATPIQTIAFYIDTLTEHVNAHMCASSCCAWHGTLHAIQGAMSHLKEKQCKQHVGWLPSSGWQCVDCLALNDVDDDMCAICYCDRTPKDGFISRSLSFHSKQSHNSERSTEEDELKAQKFLDVAQLLTRRL